MLKSFFRRPILSLGLLVFGAVPALAQAAGDAMEHSSPSLGTVLPLWTVLPFAAMLISIAVIPLIKAHWWHLTRNQALVSAIWGGPMFIYFLFIDYHQLVHTGLEYISFIVYVGALFTISGGIYIRGELKGTPVVNTSFLGVGAILANFIGTPGASMLLIRPVLRANKHRQNIAHIPLFFIFLVSNIGGCLTPLGDPPLFLGFLRGVPFFWTLHLFPEWLTAVGMLITIFFVWDTIAYRKESLSETPNSGETFGLEGIRNFIPLGIVLGAVLMTSEIHTAYERLHLPQPEMWAGLTRDGVIALAAIVSYLRTPQEVHQKNEFNFYPVKEVAVLFAGIFTTMIPAMLILKAKGGTLGIVEPWQFFWSTGLLSSVLDNAPTYLTFGSIAQGVIESQYSVTLHQIGDLILLKDQIGHAGEQLLKAISLGAVFMGANSYIGNGPNFMVRSIVENKGTPMPSFFGYMLRAALILFPVFILITFIFLR
ncbi:MAG: sodium:proton antiporter [Gemmatimonadetes bacterium]|nr:MAG: sodium:proton antiporter [Gemmatimonadota bacterium]